MATAHAPAEILSKLEDFAEVLSAFQSLLHGSEVIDVGDKIDNIAARKARMTELNRLSDRFDEFLMNAKKGLLGVMPNADRAWLKILAPNPSYTFGPHPENPHHEIQTVFWRGNEAELSAIVEDLSAEILRMRNVSNLAEQPAVELHEDGPDPNEAIWWKDNKPKPLTRKNWQLAKALWGKGAVSFADLGDAVWENDCTSPGTISSQVNRLSDQLLAIDPKRSPRFRGEAVILE